LVGKNAKINKCIGLEVKQFGKKKKLAVDLVGNKKLIGLGVSYDIWRNKYAEIDTGLYVSNKVMDLFQGKINPELKAGLSIKAKF
jgi:hypothetical protein